MSKKKAPKFNPDHPLIPQSKRTARQIIGKIKTSDLNWLTVQCFHHHRLSVNNGAVIHDHDDDGTQVLIDVRDGSRPAS